MYVAELDRPWLETPFLFQGFEIREDRELELLRQYCRHVYVDVARGTLPREQVLKAIATRHGVAANDSAGATASPPPAADRSSHAAPRPDPATLIAGALAGQHEYDNTVATRVEAPQSVRAYDAAVVTVQEVLAQVRAGAGIDAAQVQTAVRPMIDSILRNQDAMAWLVALRKRDEYTYHHSIATAVWAVILGRHLGFDRGGLDKLAAGGMLLDIGKARLREDLIAHPGKFSAAQVEAVREHVAHGLDIVRSTPGIDHDVLTMIGGHHERHDGSGYPGGLKGSEIPVFARIGGIVDCYDAMTSHRPWARARSTYDAIRELNSMAGVQFQKELVEQFVQALGMFPTGSIVELNTGEVAIVVEQNRVRRLRPRIMLVLDAAKQPLREPRTLDLREVLSDQHEANALWIVCGHETGAFGLDPKTFFIG